METCLYEPLEKGRVRCRICSHFCVVEPGRSGVCRVRQNRNGRLESLVYDKVIAQSVDPIEKKPVYHLKPGSLSYSIATVGCNLQCKFCQNADIAHFPRKRFGGAVAGRAVSPDRLVAQALDTGCGSIAYTYTEPAVYFELARDTSRLAKEKGLFNIFVTNGYMSAEAVDTIAPYLDAANVDLKAFSDGFYQTYCKARLEPVKQTLVRMKEKGILVEVTTLVIPGLNDDPDELAGLAGFIARNLGPDTPWHVSRFHPAHELNDRGATPARTLKTAFDIGKAAGLWYVYIGNLPGLGAEDTHCHSCGTTLVSRHQYRVKNHMGPEGTCPDCGMAAVGIF